MQKIKFNFLTSKTALKERKNLKLFIEQLFKNEKKILKSLNYIFCSDEYLININREFLKHDFYTDIITFDLGLIDKEVEGEIYISTERVKDNAINLKVPYFEELHRVIFHGALHLCGYKDKSNQEQKTMRLKEEEYLKKLFK